MNRRRVIEYPQGHQDHRSSGGRSSGETHQTPGCKKRKPRLITAVPRFPKDVFRFRGSLPSALPSPAIYGYISLTTPCIARLDSRAYSCANSQSAQLSCSRKPRLFNLTCPRTVELSPVPATVPNVSREASPIDWKVTSTSQHSSPRGPRVIDLFLPGGRRDREP